MQHNLCSNLIYLYRSQTGLSAVNEYMLTQQPEALNTLPANDVLSVLRFAAYYGDISMAKRLLNNQYTQQVLFNNQPKVGEYLVNAVTQQHFEIIEAFISPASGAPIAKYEFLVALHDATHKEINKLKEAQELQQPFNLKNCQIFSLIIGRLKILGYDEKDISILPADLTGYSYPSAPSGTASKPCRC